MEKNSRRYRWESEHHRPTCMHETQQKIEDEVESFNKDHEMWNKKGADTETIKNIRNHQIRLPVPKMIFNN